MTGHLEDTAMALPDRRTPKVLQHGLKSPSRAKAMRDHATNEHEDLFGVITTELCLTFGLPGEVIPLEARIVAVADSYEAIRADRTYDRVGHDDAISQIREGDERSSPNEIDPAGLRALKRAAPTIEREYRQSSAVFTPVQV